jgi:hypothetical protein
MIQNQIENMQNMFRNEMADIQNELRNLNNNISALNHEVRIIERRYFCRQASQQQLKPKTTCCKEKNAN